MSTMPARMPASLSSLSSEGVFRHLVWVRCLTHTSLGYPGDTDWPLWLRACYQVTPHLQRFGYNTALLDLGNCTDEEAVAVVHRLITRLHSQQVTLGAAIGPSGILAQLALLQLLHTSGHEPVTLVTREQRSDLLRQLPIGVLTRLQFADGTIIRPAAVTQLEGYGVRTLMHLARLDEARLCRQFGAHPGNLLAAVARGEDLLPFQPTPAPLQLHFRLRLKTSVATDCLVAGLVPFTLEVASTLARRGLQGHTLELRLRWETGISERITRTLPQPIAGGRAFNETVLRLLTPIFQRARSQHTRTPDTHDAIEDFHLIVSRLVPLYPVQHTFWQQRTRRLAAVQELAVVLTQRYGKPLLFRRSLTAPDAIFDQDRSRLAPLNADAVGTAGVLEDQGHGGGRPAADVAYDADAPDTSADIPHSIHWW